MTDDIVDVLIVGAGASGAAFAWSLADTRMRIVCFEQGDWMNPAHYPSTAVNWESQAYGPYHIDPNLRALRTDYPINNDDSAVTVVNFNGVGGSTVLYGAHFPRLHPSDFKVRTVDGVADDWPIDYDTLEPFFTTNDRVMGVSGLAGDPMYPAKQPPLRGRRRLRGLPGRASGELHTDARVGPREFRAVVRGSFDGRAL